MARFPVMALAALVACFPVRASSKSPVPDPCARFVVAEPTSVRDLLENALQRLRYAADPAAEAAAETALYAPLQTVLDPYLRTRGIVDEQRREELIDDAFLEMHRHLCQAHRTSELPRPYVPLLLVMARHRMYHAFGERPDRPIGDLGWLPDGLAAPLPTDATASFRGPDTARPYESPSASADDYAAAAGAPIPLSARQLAVLRSLAAGETHRATAEALQLGIRQVHDAVGNVERKAQEALSAPALRRSRMRFLPDLSATNRIVIECTLGARMYRLVAEGPLVVDAFELPFLTRWIAGESVPAIRAAMPELDASEARRLHLRLLIERRHDYEELFGAKEKSFAAVFEAQLPESEGEYALFRAFGVERPEIAAALGMDVRAVAARRDRLVARLKHVMHLVDDAISFLRPYYSAVGDARDQVRIVLAGRSGAMYLVRATIVNERTRHLRRKQSEPIAVPRATVERHIGAMKGRLGEVMRLRILDGLTSMAVAERLGIRVDTTRAYLADGTFRLSVAVGEPELNLHNLRLR